MINVENWDTVKLSALLEHERKYQRTPNTIAEVFGDAVLYHELPVFRIIRDTAIKMGACYSTDQLADYVSCRLLGIDDVVTSGKIPYIPNRRPLLNLENSRPDYFNVDLYLRFTPFKNVLMHESAHFVAARHTETIAEKDDRNSRIFNPLFGEAFSNAVEALAFLRAFDQPILLSYLALNSFWLGTPVSFRTILDKAVALTSPSQAAKSLMMFYTCANFGYVNATKKQLTQITEALKFNPMDEECAAIYLQLFGLAMKLNHNFVYLVNEAYLNKLGFDGDLQEMTNFCPINHFQSHSEYGELIDEFSEILVSAIDSTGVLCGPADYRNQYEPGSLPSS